MGRIATKMPSFCLNKIRPLVRVRLPPMQAKNTENPTNTSDEEKKDGFISVEKECSGSGGEKPVAGSGRKVMIVVDSSVEAKNAVQWALSHTVQNQDLVILLHVSKSKPSKLQGSQSPDGDVNGENDHKIPQFLIGMKKSCQLKRPEVQIEVAVVEGKDKGPVIVEATKKQEVALLVLGQKKRSMAWGLMLMWAGYRSPAGGVAEYCVQNASCMAIAVRRRSRKLGGYVITTKRQKDFWLLA